MTLLAVTSLEEFDCLSGLSAGTYWTSGSNVDPLCAPLSQYSWCSTGYNMSPSLISSNKFWLSTTVAPTPAEHCLAFAISATSVNGLVHKYCNESLPFICQYTVECPSSDVCIKNNSLFDSSGKLIDSPSYGFWTAIGNYTYLFGNQPMTWLENYAHCCALGMEAFNIENLAEQNALTRFTKIKWEATTNFWTSGTSKGSSAGLWSWCEPNGPTIFTQNLVWETGQPDKKGGNENCIHFRFILNATGAILSDRNCGNRYSFACKSLIIKPPLMCVATCPTGSCQRSYMLFNYNPRSNLDELKDYQSYGGWYQGCGRMFLDYTKSAENWTAARDKCCEIGMTLASMESVGKLNCFSKLVNNVNGDFWLSGTDQGCPSKFRWCSRNRDFVPAEIKWKTGHPKAGLTCVYLEVRNGTSLLATADCAEQKNPLCEIRKKATPNVAMEMECAEIWDVPSEQIDLLFNVTAFLAASVSRNLMCFIKCVGSEMGLFEFGKAMSMEVLRQIELVAQENPVLLGQAMAAFLQCSAIKFNDDCTTAYEMYKCCQQKAPGVVSAIIYNNYDNGSISSPPIGCIPTRRRCWLSENYPCELNVCI
ncbi:uncharacterized protein LOC135946183 [Cloeon dipterum]|uniref:uncharacterized protein LOC135946183 n=1 Tax=Cloeon dipterum TaxID=197152 RepID=UPI00321F928D